MVGIRAGGMFHDVLTYYAVSKREYHDVGSVLTRLGVRWKSEVSPDRRFHIIEIEVPAFQSGAPIMERKTL